MTKADLVQLIYNKVEDITKKQASEYVETLLAMIKDTLVSGDNIKISGFGSFIVREKRARRGRNPKTGDALIITPRKVVTFRPSQRLKSSINSQ